MPTSPREVDKVEITCLVDNTVDILLPTTDVARRPKTDHWFERPLVAEHGFSSVVTVEVDGRRRSLLFDSGLDLRAIEAGAIGDKHNLERGEAADGADVDDGVNGLDEDRKSVV